jgi:mono/diheme cytochrome c family protein
MKVGLFSIAALGICAIAFVTGQQPPGAPVYTAAQATAGRTAYEANCASCHVADLGGETKPRSSPAQIS